MKTRPLGRIRTGRKSFAQTLRENNAADKFLASMAGVEPQAQSIVSDYKRRNIKPKADGELSELQEQIRVVTWFDKHCHEYDLPPVALIAIPNGGGRGLFEAANMKKAGVRAGVEDLLLAVPVMIYHGLFIEMKIVGGKVEAEQHAMHHFHKRQGYAVEVAWSHQEAIEVIQKYLGG